MEKSKEKALGSLQSIVEFYQELYKNGVIEEGSSGFKRLLQLERHLKIYGRGGRSQAR
jgi:hypothetical protein|tara:strand:+ start:439 stop:612 length:174 start_codon:yes stop_codon:yes gene_type:complete